MNFKRIFSPLLMMALIINMGLQSFNAYGMLKFGNFPINKNNTRPLTVKTNSSQEKTHPSKTITIFHTKDQPSVVGHRVYGSGAAVAGLTSLGFFKSAMEPCYKAFKNNNEWQIGIQTGTLASLLAGKAHNKYIDQKYPTTTILQPSKPPYVDDPLIETIKPVQTTEIPFYESEEKMGNHKELLNKCLNLKNREKRYTQSMQALKYGTAAIASSLTAGALFDSSFCIDPETIIVALKTAIFPTASFAGAKYLHTRSNKPYTAKELFEDTDTAKALKKKIITEYYDNVILQEQPQGQAYLELRSEFTKTMEDFVTKFANYSSLGSEDPKKLFDQIREWDEEKLKSLPS